MNLIKIIRTEDIEAIKQAIDSGADVGDSTPSFIHAYYE